MLSLLFICELVAYLLPRPELVELFKMLLLKYGSYVFAKKVQP